MLDRRNFIRLSMGLAALLVPADSTRSDTIPTREQFPSYRLDMNELEDAIAGYGPMAVPRKDFSRKSMFFSYEEWKVTREPLGPNASTQERIKYDITKDKVREKALDIIRHPDEAYKLMNPTERELFKYELKLSDPFFDCMDLNKNYNLHIPVEDFKASLGIKIFWFFDRMLSYYHTDVKEQEKRRKASMKK
jgi:hypothetical protein